MAVRQFNRKRRARAGRVHVPAAASKIAAPKIVARRAAPTKNKGDRGPASTIPAYSGRRKPVGSAAAGGSMLHATQAFATALSEVETLLRTVHRGQAEAIKSLNSIARAVLRAAAQLERTRK